MSRRRLRNTSRRSVVLVAAALAILPGWVFAGAAANEIVMVLPEGIDWAPLPKETMGDSYERPWIPAGSDPGTPEWVIVEQRLSMAQPMTPEAIMDIMQELSRGKCEAVKFEGPHPVDTDVGEGVWGRTYCTHDLGTPYGAVSDQRIVVDGTIVFVVTSSLRTSPSPAPGEFTFASEAESEAFGKLLLRSSAFVQESVRIGEQSSEPGTHIEVPGNLAATNPLDCVAVEAVSNSHTAADIASGARSCFDEGDDDAMADLMLVASAFAYYDTLRVTDESAHAALTALFADRFADIPSTQRDRVATAIDALADDRDRVGALCAKLADLGPPEYWPTYMLAHGLGTLVGEEKEPAVRNIDRAAGWKQALSFTNCPESRSDEQVPVAPVTEDS